MTLANAMVLVDQTAVPLTLPAIVYGAGLAVGVTLLGVAGCILAARAERLAVAQSTAASGEQSPAD